MHTCKKCHSRSVLWIWFSDLVLKDQEDEEPVWWTEAVWVYICLFFSDLTWIHRLCVNKKEMDLYVWTRKVNTAAPRSVTGISYKADNCSTQRTCQNFYSDKDRNDGKSKGTAGWLKPQQYKNNSQDLGDANCFKECCQKLRSLVALQWMLGEKNPCRVN